MKRTIGCLLCSLLLLALCACGQPEPVAPDEEAQPAVGELPGGESTAAPDPFSAPVPASETVDGSWFSDAVFIGDSVSVMLRMYNETYGVLGDATFLCAVSLSQTGALSAQTGSERLPEWPAGSGQHPRIADAVAACGAKKVYLMLGMNCIAGGVDRATDDLVTLVGQIREQVPDAAILIESVTPMTQTSPRADASLNNDTIGQFNARMQQHCQANQWYYVNVAEALSDEGGWLRDDYSGDTAMGIHLDYKGAGAWADYLLTHVPSALK